MAKGAYVGINNIARRVIKGYVGINGVARKIMKAYIGVGGVARPCWFSGIAHYGLITPLSEERVFPGFGSVNNRAIFAGGGYIRRSKKGVDAYDTSLTRNSSVFLDKERTMMGSASLNNYAIFAGGLPIVAEDALNTVEAFNASLTHIVMAPICMGKYAVQGGNMQNLYAVFAGGKPKSSNDLPYDQYDIYDKNLSHIGTSSFNEPRAFIGSASIGNYLLFAGGTLPNDEHSARVDAFNGTTTILSLSNAQSSMYGASTPSYAIFGGGDSIYDAFNSSLTRINIGTLSIHFPYSTASLGGYALFCCNTQLVIFDDLLTRTTIPTAMATTDTSNNGSAGATVGNYALFAGGMKGSNFKIQTSVDAYILIE